MNIISWKIKVDKAHLVKYAPFPLVKDGPHLRTFLQSFLQNVDSRVKTFLVFLKVDGYKAGDLGDIGDFRGYGWTLGVLGGFPWFPGPN